MTNQSSTDNNKTHSLADQGAHDVTPQAGVGAQVGTATVTNAANDVATKAATNTGTDFITDHDTNLVINSTSESLSNPALDPATASLTSADTEFTFDFESDGPVCTLPTTAASSDHSDHSDQWDLPEPSDPSAATDEWAEKDDAVPSDQPDQTDQPRQPNQPNQPHQPDQPTQVGPNQPEPGQLDCAYFVGAKMLDRALGPWANPPRPGLFIVQTSNSAWTSTIKNLIDPYLKRRPGQARRRSSRRPYIYQGPTICSYGMTAEEQSSDLTSENNRLLQNIEQNLAAGSVVFIVTDDLETVPLAFRHAADRIFILPPPNRQAVIALLREIAPGAKRFDLLDVPVEQLMPHMLRLAYRPAIKTQTFLRRLKQLSTPVPKIIDHQIIPFSRLHGVEKAEAWADELKQDLQDYAAKKLTWSQARRSLLLCGVPGTAKTTLARTIAAHCDIGFVATSYAKWQRDQRGHLGDVLRAMASVFAEARACAPCVLFIDELDTLGSRGDNSPQRSDWWRSIINALLEQIAGVDSNEGVIIIGATNYPELIDPAILRSGRMEDHIMLYPPEPAALARIYQDELQGHCADSVDLKQLGYLSAGKTGADVVRICAAARRKARNQSQQVTQEDLIAALDKDGGTLSAEHRRRIAIHEAGHAVVMHQLDGVEVTSITVIGTGETGGATMSTMTEHNFLTPSLLETRLIALMGGRAAEAVLLGDVSSGSGGAEGSDLGSATVLAAQAELSLGLGSQGLIWQMPPTARTVGEWLGRRPDVAEAVRKRLDRAYQRACELIRARIRTVEKLAEALLRHQALAGEDLARLLQDDAVPGDTTPLPHRSRRHDPLGYDPVGHGPLSQGTTSGKPAHSEGSAPSGANSRCDDQGATPTDSWQASTARPDNEPSAI
ncbi:cell division protease FtsH [Acidiphilium sp. MT5]